MSDETIPNVHPAFMSDETVKTTKKRVSNEQILAAIMATNTNLNALIQVLANQKKEEQVLANQKKEEPVAPPTVTETATISHAVVSNGPRLIKDLPLTESLPQGIRADWLGGMLVKASNWAKSKAPGEEVWVYFVRNSVGTHFPMFARGTSKAAYNAVSRWKLAK